MKKYRGMLIAFSSGMLVMIFELLASRIVGVHTGNSLYVWTNIIALILGALALGYKFGGIRADMGEDEKVLSHIFMMTGFLFLYTFLTKDFFGNIITRLFPDIRISSFLLVFVVFVPASFLLGMVQPIVTKLHLKNLQKAGHIIGTLGSLNTVGSIVGTLAAGFFLIPFFGVNSLLLILASISFFLSCISHFQINLKTNLLGFLLIVFLFFVQKNFEAQNEKLGRWSYDTSYSHIFVQDGVDSNGESIRNLYIDNITHAGKYLEKSDLLYPYTKAYDLFSFLFPSSEKVVMFGGAAYSYPQHFLEKYPEKHLDVVEIDPKITHIAEKHFGLSPEKQEKLGIIHEDARVFLNQNLEKYDVILGDAFGSYYSLPFQLTTVQVAQKKFSSLTPDGGVLVNIIGSLEGENSRFIQAEYKTYAQIFPEVFLVPIETQDPQKVQNIMLVALKNPVSLENVVIDNLELARLYENRIYPEIDPETQLLTDNYAPVDYYISKLAE